MKVQKRSRGAARFAVCLLAAATQGISAVRVNNADASVTQALDQQSLELQSAPPTAHANHRFKAVIPGVGQANGFGSAWADAVNYYSLPFGMNPDGDRVLKPPEAYPIPWPHPMGTHADVVPLCNNFVNPGDVRGGRDCLHLNVHVPLAVASLIDQGRSVEEALPVMVWIHGGAFKEGNSHGGGLHDGSSFVAEQQVIISTVNYRLGPEGFLAHPAMLTHGSAYNLGLLDQRLAMKWMHDHSAAFGGDPARTVLFGESSGAMSVCFHLTSPQSYEYFNGAILQSGSCENPATWLERERAETFSRVVSEVIGCGRDEHQNFQCLQENLWRWRGLSWEEWFDIGNGLGVAPDTRLEPLVPVVDLLPTGLMDQPGLLVEAGQFHKVPMIVGTNKDEGALFRIIAPVPGETRQSFADFLFYLLGPSLLEDLYELYGPIGSAGDFRKALGDIIGDLLFNCPTYNFVRAVSRQSVDVFAFRFTNAVSIRTALGSVLNGGVDFIRSGGEADWQRAFGLYLTWQGVPHSMDLFFLFDADRNPAPSVKVLEFGASERRLIDHFQALWGKFGRDLDPNGAVMSERHGSIPETAWPRYNASDHDGTTLRITDPPSLQGAAGDIEADVERRCSFWLEHRDLLKPPGGRPWMTEIDRNDLGNRCCCLERDSSLCRRVPHEDTTSRAKCPQMDFGNGMEETSHAENGCLPEGYKVKQCCCVSAEDVGLGATEPLCQDITDPDLGRSNRCPFMCTDRESEVGISPCTGWFGGMRSYHDESACAPPKTAAISDVSCRRRRCR